MPNKKLIEVSLPLEAINKESVRDKSIRHGHPSTLHLWWSRKPLAAARAVLFAQLVDDPSSHPDRFPTEDTQAVERERLHKIIRRLVVWKNSGDQGLLDEARTEILSSTGGNPPAILDPFAGGGAIPLEAQRLGLEAHASDLNPVAVLIDKALIEFPPRFANRPPVAPGLATTANTWSGAEGLAADVQHYGEWMRQQAEARIGHLYPKAALPDGTTATVIAWIWARTVTCPNPACGIEMPLVNSWWLGRKKGKEAYVVPTVVADAAQPSGKRVEYSIGHDKASAPTSGADGTVGRRGGLCVACGTAVPLSYLRAEGRAGRMSSALMAVVAEGNRRRIYLPPSDTHIQAALVERPGSVPNDSLPNNPRDFKTPNYGMTTWADLFTNRQLTALTTLSGLVAEAREQAYTDARAARIPDGARLDAGGTNAAAYSDAIAVYLAMATTRTTDRHTSVATWDSSPSKEQVRGVFAHQAIAMAWGFAEANPFARSSGTFAESVVHVVRVLQRVPATPPASAEQADASKRDYDGAVVSTDPPYYDNIGYSDLSDFFYVWQRRALGGILPSLFGTVLVPKSEELVANPYRNGGSDGAKAFFEDGFRKVFRRARLSATDDYPITVYYAFKQSDVDENGTSSSGWETLLEGMVHNAWTITSTWPLRSELRNRMTANGTNALASSIVLSLRPRPDDAPVTDRRGFIAALKRELRAAVHTLQADGIAAVDLAQAAIGPGMGVFSRHSRVLRPDGTAMTVHEALQEINAVLDETLSQGEGEFDTGTRWCTTWFASYGFDQADYGDAERLATAKNSSVDSLVRAGVVSSGRGRVRLLPPDELPDGYDPRTDDRVTLWEVVLHTARALDEKGLDDAGRLLSRAGERGIDLGAAHTLAYRLYMTADTRGLTQPARLFNTLTQSWADVEAAARTAASADAASRPVQLDLESLEEA